MTFTPIAKGTQNWDVPLNAALAALDAQTGTVSSASLQRSNNLSDLTNTVAARTNLGLSQSAAVGSVSFNAKDYGAKGDGTTDDTNSIQSAINAANTAGGGLIVIPQGSYKLTATLHLGPNVVVDARGAYLFAGANTTFNLLDNYLNQTSPTVYNGNGNIEVIGGIWDGKGQTYTTIATNTVFFGHAYGIICRDMILRNTRAFHGIEFNSISNGQILNCRFEGYSTGGISDPGEAIQIDVAIAGAGLPANDNTESTHINIDGCYAGPAADGSGLGAPGSLVGAHSAAANNSYQDIRVVNSTAQSTLSYGIHAYNWAKCELVGNTIINSGDIGIYVDTQNTGGYQPDAISVNSNSITGSAGAGIFVNGSGAFASNYVADISITGNTVRNVTTGTTPTGINVVFAQGVTVSDNTIYNCSTSGVTVTTSNFATVATNTIHTCATGISVGGSTQVTISGNNLNTGTSNGIFLGQSASAVNTTDVLITGNRIENFTNAQVRGGTNATDVSVIANKLIQGANGTNGIFLVSTNTNWQVYDNHLDGTWALAAALNTFNTTTNVTVWPDGRTGVRGNNTVGTQLNPVITKATVANTASETVLATATIPANDAVTGGVYRIQVFGTASSTATPTITFNVRLGGVAGTTIASFTAVTTASGVANGAWQVNVDLYNITTGSSATWSASSTLRQQINSLTTSVQQNVMTNGTVTSNSTVAIPVVVTATWSAASASNTASSTGGILIRDF